jgi:hypothetical protein
MDGHGLNLHKISIFCGINIQRVQYAPGSIDSHSAQGLEFMVHSPAYSPL